MAACSEQRRHLLPVRRCQDRIIDKVKLNRVTLIFAETGSGKSTQVPQMLLESGLAPILCTQPRRLAVVAVANEVAKERGYLVGQEIGYHIGQDKLVSTNSKIIFQTAGVLLEELRCKGIQVFSYYKVLILDEVHERSIESDLVLTCVKRLISWNRNIRLVLMSATADSMRYKEYSGDIGRGEKVEIIPICSLGVQLQNIMFQCKVHYLEKVVSLLGNVPGHLSLLNAMKEYSVPYENGIDIGLRIQKIITDLVVYIHRKEVSSKSLMIFLPTYRALEQQWVLLKETGLPLKLYVLHSSIDMEHSIRAIKACHPDRKVILATNVAESSVTVPGISYVIDSCRSLEIYWDDVRKFHMPRLVWVSESQANQRKGRAARTCDGEVFRMVPRAVFQSFKKFETPAIQLLSLHKQVLTVACAQSKAINDPLTFFQRALDPPDDSRVRHALDVLQSINAVRIQDDLRGKCAPTFYGRLLASLPLSLEAAALVIKGGQQGMLREATVIAALMDMSPLPILKPFSKQNQYEMHLQCYYSPPGYSHGESCSFSYPSVLLANLIAFDFWQCVFKDKHRLERLAKYTGNSDCLENDLQSSFIEEQQKWCSAHYLCPSALCNAYETSTSILETLHRFRPQFMNKLNGPPSYFAYEIEHACNLLHKGFSPAHILEEDEVDMYSECMVCTEDPFFPPEVFHSNEKLPVLANLISEAQKIYQHASAAENAYEDTSDNDSPTSPLCHFFQSGRCINGNACSFSHSRSAKPAVCRFFSTSGCRYGADCRFLHDVHTSMLTKKDSSLDLEEDSTPPDSFSSILPFWKDYSISTEEPSIQYKDNETGCYEDSNYYVLVFGEEDFTFSESLSKHYIPSKIIVTSTKLKEDSYSSNESDLSSRISLLFERGVKILWGLNADKLSSRVSDNIPWTEVGYVIWIIKASGDEDVEGQKKLVRKFFTSLSRMIFSEGIENMQLLLTLNNNQYVVWQVERAARDGFFFLSRSTPAVSGYSTLEERVNNMFNKPKLVAYLFEFHPPTGCDWDYFEHAAAQQDELL